MPRQTPTDKLQTLKEQQRQIEARIKAETAKLSEQARKDETRRKIVAGALALEHMGKNPNDAFGSKMRQLLQEYAPDNARHLFDFLEPRPNGKASKTGAAASQPPAADAAE